MMRNVMIRIGAACLTGASVAALVAPTAAQAQQAGQNRAFDIPAQSLAAALEAFGRQSHAEIIFDRAAVAGKRSSAVRGNHPPSAALHRLLGGTGLVARMPNADTFMVSAAPKPVVRNEAAMLAAPDAQADEEIIVTAQKREQTLFEIPQAVSVVSGERLERQQATSFADYAALVPSLTLEQASPAETRLVLRGINTGSSSSTVAVYVDETPFGSSSSLGNAAVLAGNFDTFDIARIEVLRGPQGTLYGANALSGVFKFVTTAPVLGTFQARGQAGIESASGGNSGWSANGVVNVPLGDTVALRASGFYRKTPGFIDAIGRTGRNINEFESYGGRASLLFEPTDDLSIRLTAVAQNIRANSSTSFDTEPGSLSPLAVDPFTGGNLDGRPVRFEYYPDRNHVDYRLYNGTVNYDLGPATLTSATSYGVLDQIRPSDATGLPSNPGSLGNAVTGIYGAFGGATAPLGAVLLTTIRQEKFTQELRLASSDTDTLEWLIGGYYTDEKIAVLQRYDPFVRASGQLLTDRTLVLPFGPGGANVTYPEFVLVNLDSSYKEYAAFGSLTWHITPRFDVTAGGRYSHNKQSSDQSIAGAYVPLTGGGLGPLLTAGRSSENVFTWSIAPRFELSDTVSLFARVAKGYRPGGPNVVPPGAGPGFPFEFQADTLLSYEAGIHAQTADRSFAIDAAVYYIDWKDVLVIGTYPTPVGDVVATDNGGGARSAGAEATVTLRPASGLSLVANIAYNDAELTDATPVATGGLDGDQLPYSAKWSANLSADYEWALSGSARAFVGGNLRLIGDQQAGFSPVGRLSLDGYATLDLRAGVDLGRVSLSVFARNLTDATGFTSAMASPDRPGGVSVSPIRPRTIGAALGFEF
jgi:outer membrane receptor protein involved in Fe transport